MRPIKEQNRHSLKKRIYNKLHDPGHYAALAPTFLVPASFYCERTRAEARYSVPLRPGGFQPVGDRLRGSQTPDTGHRTPDAGHDAAGCGAAARTGSVAAGRVRSADPEHQSG